MATTSIRYQPGTGADWRTSTAQDLVALCDTEEDVLKLIRDLGLVHAGALSSVTGSFTVMDDGEPQLYSYSACNVTTTTVQEVAPEIELHYLFKATAIGEVTEHARRWIMVWFDRDSNVDLDEFLRGEEEVLSGNVHRFTGSFRYVEHGDNRVATYTIQPRLTRYEPYYCICDDASEKHIWRGTGYKDVEKYFITDLGMRHHIAQGVVEATRGISKDDPHTMGSFTSDHADCDSGFIHYDLWLNEDVHDEKCGCKYTRTT